MGNLTITIAKILIIWYNKYNKNEIFLVNIYRKAEIKGMAQFKYIVNSFDFINAGNVSQDIKKKLTEMNINSEKIRRAVLAVYEGEINMMIHANGGIIEVDVTDDCIKMVLSDNGPGIADVDLAMQSGYSTVSDSGVISQGFGAGMGFSNMKSMSDTIDVQSKLGLGTTITMTINLI